MISSILAMPKGASVPSLGLSNKAVFDESVPVAANDRHIKDIYPDNYFVPMSMDCESRIEFHIFLEFFFFFFYIFLLK